MDSVVFASVTDELLPSRVGSDTVGVKKVVCVPVSAVPPDVKGPAAELVVVAVRVGEVPVFVLLPIVVATVPALVVLLVLVLTEGAAVLESIDVEIPMVVCDELSAFPSKMHSSFCVSITRRTTTDEKQTISARPSRIIRPPSQRGMLLMVAFFRGLLCTCFRTSELLLSVPCKEIVYG